MSEVASAQLERDYLATGVFCYILALDADKHPVTSVLDGTMVGNLTRFINHLCRPNCKLREMMEESTLVVAILARKTDQPGTKLTSRLPYRGQFLMRYPKQLQGFNMQCFSFFYSCSLQTFIPFIQLSQ